MNKADRSFLETEANALERAAKAAKAELEKRVREASTAEAEQAYLAGRAALEIAHDDAREGLDLFAETLARQSRA